MNFTIWAYKLVSVFPPPCALFYFGNISTFLICLHHLWAYSAHNKFSPPSGWVYMKNLLCLHHVPWWSANTFRLICPNQEILENKYGGGQSKNWPYTQTCFCSGIFCELYFISTIVAGSFGHIAVFSYPLHHAPFPIWAYKLVFVSPPPYDIFYFGNIFTFFICLHHLWAYSAPNKFSPPSGWVYMKYLLRLHHVPWWSASSFHPICPNQQTSRKLVWWSANTFHPICPNPKISKPKSPLSGSSTMHLWLDYLFIMERASCQGCFAPQRGSSLTAGSPMIPSYSSRDSIPITKLSYSHYHTSFYPIKSAKKRQL
ncbi:hypothetical protein SAMN02910453_0506 [Lachnospiraceae bacterium A10]|nr:hypothetical protein SAMN02910453_0506 [Lachnospiraceae bacterium A10]